MSDAALDLRPVMPPVRKMDYRVGKKLGHRARIGAVVLASDETMEYEFRTVLNSLDDGLRPRIEAVLADAPLPFRTAPGPIAVRRTARRERDRFI